MHEIKTEILQVCQAFNLGSFKNSMSYSNEINGYIKTTFETSTGFYTHYFKVKN